MMEQDWAPQVEQVQECVHMLQALRDPTRSDHSLALASLTQRVAQPSFALTMMHVFSCGALYPHQQALTTDLRQLAGLVIKNYVFPHLGKLSADVQAILKREVIRVVQDEILDVRRTGAILAGKISESFPVTTWGDMMPPILQMLDISLQTTKPHVLSGALQATQRICEDSGVKLALDEVRRPLDELVPRLLALMSCSDPEIRIGALSSYNALLYLLGSPSTRSGDNDWQRSRNSSFHDSDDNSSNTERARSPISPQGNLMLGNAAHPLMMHMNAFISQLSLLSTDTNHKVRTVVCQAITIISTTHVAVLEPFFPDICNFMLVALQDTEECVAIESCEFWAVMVESPDTKRAICPYLRTLIEHLIQRLYLTAEQMEQERIEEEEENSGEKELNLRPMHHRVQGGHNGSAVDHDAEDKENAELSSKWTLRKQAALLLDTVAISFPPQDVLAAALPRIQGCFQHAEPLVRECGMLALGALSTGCIDEMAQYIPSLFPFLLQNIQSPLPELRSIICWVLSRYCSLFPYLNMTDEDQQAQRVSAEGASFYGQTLQALLVAMFDPNTKVQVAACSALSVLVEQAFQIPASARTGASSVGGTESINILLPQLPSVLGAISKAFNQYGVKSSLILVDTIGAIADSVGAELRSPHLTALYLPQLIQRFDALDDFDMRMFPMLECLASVLAAIGLEAQQYVVHIYTRCLRMVSIVISSNQQDVLEGCVSPLKSTDADAGDEPPNKDFAICGLDVISALCEGLGELFATLARDTGTQETLFQLMFAAMQDSLPELRQSSFSLAGELSKHCVALVGPTVAAQLVQQSIPCLNTDFPLVCNNAAWAVGELALQVGGDFLHQFINQLMYGLITALQTAHLPDNIRVNVAVTIGRLGIVDTLEVAALADEYFADWCSVLELPCPIAERMHSFQGMLSILHKNPNLVLDNKTNLYSLLVTLSAWHPDAPSPELVQGFREVLITTRSHNPTMWGRVINKFSLHHDFQVIVKMLQLPMA